MAETKKRAGKGVSTTCKLPMEALKPYTEKGNFQKPEPKPIAETVEFPYGCPCRVRSRVSDRDELPLPHFAPTVEIILTEGVGGHTVSAYKKHFLSDL